MYNLVDFLWSKKIGQQRNDITARKNVTWRTLIYMENPDTENRLNCSHPTNTHGMFLSCHFALILGAARLFSRKVHFGYIQGTSVAQQHNLLKKKTGRTKTNVQHWTEMNWHPQHITLHRFLCSLKDTNWAHLRTPELLGLLVFKGMADSLRWKQNLQTTPIDGSNVTQT